MNHSFNVDVAKDVGVVPAVILEHIAFWVLKNESNGTAFQDGKHWTFSTAEGFQKYFPYLSAKQIRDAIKKLSDKGYLITGCFNSKPMDRTKWYSLGEKADELYRLSEEKNPSVELTKKSNASDEKVKCILQNGQMHLTKKSNALYIDKDIEKDIEKDKGASPSLVRGNAEPKAARNVSKPKLLPKYSPEWWTREGIPKDIAEAHAAIRKEKKAPFSEAAIKGIKREASKGGFTIQEAVQICVERNWIGFNHDWLHQIAVKPNHQRQQQPSIDNLISDSSYLLFGDKNATGTAP